MSVKPVKNSDYSILESFLADSRTTRLRQSQKTSFHVALLVKRGKILASASNRIGSRSSGCGYSDCTIHAERNCIKSLGDLAQLRDCDMYVMRINENKTTGMRYFSHSKPCGDCQLVIEKCQKKFGLRNIYYTDTDAGTGTGTDTDTYTDTKR
jgi:hypothetical protein